MLVSYTLYNQIITYTCIHYIYTHVYTLITFICECIYMIHAACTGWCYHVQATILHTEESTADWLTGVISKAASWGYNQDWNVLKPLDKRLVVVPLFFVGYAHRSSFVWKGHTHSPFGYITLCLRCQHSSTNPSMMLTSQRHQQLRPFNCIIWVHLNQLSVVKWSDVIGPWFQRPSVAKAVWTNGGSECDTKVNRCSEHCAKAFCFPSFFWIYVVRLFVFCVSEHGISPV